MRLIIAVLVLACTVVADDDETMAGRYLNQYHYISPSRSGNHNVKKALENFQAFTGLPVTGELDPATIEQMKKPRCGVPDVDDSGLRVRRFKTGSRWGKKELTYHIEHGVDLSHDVQDKVFARALQYWADVSGLSFTRTMEGHNANLKISFGPREHGGQADKEGRCTSPFDGPNGILAHAFFPSNGRAHFDEAETFTDGTPDGTNLLWVATHEFGHALGLHHTDVKGAVMYPIYLGYVPDFNLQSDDINGIQSLYGDKNGAGETPCVDKDANCKGWAEAQYCYSNDWVMSNCLISCRQCG